MAVSKNGAPHCRRCRRRRLWAAGDARPTPTENPLGQPVIMVPTPSSVSSSISSECGCRPSMMCVALTPWLSERTQQSILGIMPPAMMPSSTNSLHRRMLSDANLVAGSSLSRSTPGTSVIRMSFSARRDAAISPAAVSALTLSAWPWPSVATDAMTGM